MLSKSVNCTASVIIFQLTIPITVVSGDRNFSKLKLIKNDLRSTVTQERLSDLAMIL